MSMQVPVYWKGLGDSSTFSLDAIAPVTGILSIDVPLFLSSTVAAHADNYWTVTLEVNGTDRTGTSISNAATAFTEYVDRTLKLDEVKVSKGDRLELVFTKAGSGADLSAVNIYAAAQIVA